MANRTSVSDPMGVSITVTIKLEYPIYLTYCVVAVLYCNCNPVRSAISAGRRCTARSEHPADHPRDRGPKQKGRGEPWCRLHPYTRRSRRASAYVVKRLRVS